MPEMCCKLSGLFILLTFWCIADCKDLTLQSVVGDVVADNFTYFTLGYDGPISLILDSLEGDADLYISQFLLHPSYNTSEYCLHSATCGQDRVDIPSSFQRPIGVGVYGHVLHPSTTFQLTVVLRDEFGQMQEGFETLLESDYLEMKRVGGTGNSGYRIPQSEEQSVFSSMLWTFLEILLEVLFA